MITLKDMYEYKQDISNRNDINILADNINKRCSVYDNKDRTIRVEGNLDDCFIEINEAIEQWYGNSINIPVTMLYNRFILDENNQLIKL